ncbi:MAG: cyclic nucleotide-binding domain-containing protein [Pseudomonadota bacterium]|nr:MAG: cyclic nucleotide-binding domain-containing protein [Pseudomonadota bacterium]
MRICDPLLEECQIRDAVQRAIEGNHPFSELLSSADREYLVDRSAVRSAAPGEIVCCQHERDTSVFLLVTGCAEVSEAVGDDQVVLAQLRQGELFGEISALFEVPRVSSVRVVRPSVLLEIPAVVLSELLVRRPLLRDAVLSRYRHRLTETALRAVNPLRHLAPAALAQLIENSNLLAVPGGEAIVREGEPGDAVYVIIAGAARVCHQAGGRDLNLALLRAGDYFGEWSILTGTPRTASVTSLTRVDAVRIDSRAFLDLFQQYPEVRADVGQVAHNRHEVVAFADAFPDSAAKLHSLLCEMEQGIQQQRDSHA